MPSKDIALSVIDGADLLKKMGLDINNHGIIKATMNIFSGSHDFVTLDVTYVLHKEDLEKVGFSVERNQVKTDGAS